MRLPAPEDLLSDDSESDPDEEEGAEAAVGEERKESGRIRKLPAPPTLASFGGRGGRGGGGQPAVGGGAISEFNYRDAGHNWLPGEAAKDSWAADTLNSASLSVAWLGESVGILCKGGKPK